MIWGCFLECQGNRRCPNGADFQTARTSRRRGLPNGADFRTARTSKRRGLPDGAEFQTAQLPERPGRALKCSQMHAIHAASSAVCGKCAVMVRHRNLAVGDAAEQLSVAVTRLSDRTRQLLHRQQLLRAAQSISSNIAEGFGRTTLADRNSRLIIARGEAEETIRLLRANFACKRITPQDYWPLHNLAVTIIKMLNSLLAKAVESRTQSAP